MASWCSLYLDCRESPGKERPAARAEGRRAAPLCFVATASMKTSMHRTIPKCSSSLHNGAIIRHPSEEDIDYQARCAADRRVFTLLSLTAQPRGWSRASSSVKITDEPLQGFSLRLGEE